MKKKILLAIFSIAMLTTNCENFGLLGQGGVKGTEVKKELNDTLLTGSFLNWGLAGGRFGISIGSLLPSIILTYTVDGITVPGLAQCCQVKSSVADSNDILMSFD